MTTRNRRLSAGPAEVYAYHDYRTRPWSSSLYAGVNVGPVGFEVHLPPESRLRPFSGDTDD